jgi:N-methylhydantoinase A
VVNAKLPTTSHDPGEALVNGTRALIARLDLVPGGLEGVVHGTTVATNALLENKGAPTGLLTTEGFRDVLEIRRHVRGQGRIYDLFFVPPQPIVPRHLRKEVRERVDARGRILVPLDEEGALARAREHVRENWWWPAAGPSPSSSCTPTRTGITRRARGT